MESRWWTAGVVGLAMVGAPLGCNQIAGIREGIPLDGNSQLCSTVADCVSHEPTCRTGIGCESGQCIFDDSPEGTPLPDQVEGDCTQLVCDGSGATKLIALASDAPDDGNICTLDECEAMAPKHTVQPLVPCYTGPPGTEGNGICTAGLQHCNAEGIPIGTCEGEVVPSAETCISPLDEDCDGKANEEGDGCVCVWGEITSCYTGPSGTENVGICHGGMHSCNEDGLGYGPCIGEQLPQLEECDPGEVDEDCDGSVNEEGANCVCGDGYVSAGEGCDDSNLDPTDLCTDVCQPAACGDGILQPLTGEGCDDGGLDDGDPCSPTCQPQEVVQVVAGSLHSCAILNDNRVKCWGRGEQGVLGLDDTTNRGDEPGEMGDNLPSLSLGTGKTVVWLSAGSQHTCALMNDGSIKCWGTNQNGQLGLGDAANRGDDPGEMGDNLPSVDLGTGKTATAVSAGDFHTCALLNDGSVKCWGRNHAGCLGLGDEEERGDEPGEMGDNLPSVDLGVGKTATSITAGSTHTCALLNDNSVKCWGHATFGALGAVANYGLGDEPGEMGDNLPPVSLGASKSAVAISAGNLHTCAILNDGNVKCWGYNAGGQLGLGDTVSRGDDPGEMGDNLPPVSLGSGKTAVALAAGNNYTCALLNDSSLKCWGTNTEGQLGLGDTSPRGTYLASMGNNLPTVNLGGGKTAIAIAAQFSHTCAILSDHSIKCWGYGEYGRLGLESTDTRGDGPGEMGDALPTVKLFTPFW